MVAAGGGRRGKVQCGRPRRNANRDRPIVRLRVSRECGKSAGRVRPRAEVLRCTASYGSATEGNERSARSFVFEGTVIVTIDGSDLALAAARQAVDLAEPDARVLAVTVSAEAGVGDALDIDSRAPSPAAAAEALETAAAALRAGRANSVETRILHGFAPHAITATVEQEAAVLLSVGMRHRRRAEGFLTGAMATEVLHGAPCSVLAGRVAGRPQTGLIVVGVDGSPASVQALAVARQVCRRRGGRLLVVTATGGRPIDVEAVRAAAGNDQLTVETGKPVDALAQASLGADLLVVGGRGLHGLRSLGSVSERIAHSAECSTLVIR
jgi:nucleotide-binding universal stress UspA family protein